MSHGLTQGEADIMDLWDSVTSDVAEIAQRTGYGRSYVEQVIGRYNVNDRILSAFDKMSVAGTASLLAAIKCFHPEIFAQRQQ